jgi:hypothetical protein
MELKAPPFWHVLLCCLFKVESARWREDLWRRYPKSAELIYQLRLCTEPAFSALDLAARVKHLEDFLEPRWLIRAAEGLVQPGRVRPKELINFEEAMLQITDKNGKWRG